MQERPADPAVMHAQVLDLHEGTNLGAVALRGSEESQDQAHRVHGRVGHPDSRFYLGVQVGLFTQGMLGRQSLGGDPGIGARIQERLQVLHVLVAHRDEQAAVLLKASGGDAFEDRALPDALDSRLAIADRIASPAVQETVVASAGARGQLPSLNQGDAHAAQGEIVRHAPAGGSSTHDQNVGVVSTWLNHPPPHFVAGEDRRSAGGGRYP